jgi:glutamyl-tRNA synthetase
VPQMAHIPLIHGPDGSKLSKRHGALGVDAYRGMGYLPEALRNYLVRLGWSHGDQEIFSTEEMIEAFDLDQIGRSPARFDFAKLENLNGHYMRRTSDEDLVDALEAVLAELGPPRGLGPTLGPDLRRKFLGAMPGLKERAKTLVELLDSAYFLYANRPLRLDDKARNLLADGGRERLTGLDEKLAALAEWTPEALEATVRAHAEALGVKLGQVAQPLRAALTGRTTSPGLFDVMAVLGREETLGRLRDQTAGIS